LLVRANHPPVSSVAPLAESVANGRETVANVNNRGEAYTENLGSGRQGRESWGVKVPLPSVARNGRLAYPLLREVTN
jgi:hypothetical protein